jgi:glycerol-3-phosphate acyltransferase PlsY
MENTIVAAVLLIVGAYLLGAVPFGLFIGWAHGLDIRQHGSRNIGATNVGRVVGRKWGLLCLVLDILKGLSATLTASFVLHVNRADPQQQLALLAVAIAAVLGHVFPVYLGFRGGKGVATTIGVALGIWPHYTVAMCVALGAYAALRFTTRTVSAGSLALAVVFPVAFFVYTLMRGLALADYWPLQAVAVVLGLVIIVRHRENIRRLVRGEELHVKPTTSSEQAPPT